MSITSFSQLNLQPVIQSTLEEHKFETPTPVQKEAIPLLLAGKDLLATAQTGTGKTLAFAIPVVSKLLEKPQSVALVLVPTRELAQQVLKTFVLLSKKQKLFKTALLIGGAYMRQQCSDLSKNPGIIVATPGRLIDHLARRTFDPSAVSFVVLDEMDRMLDMGFGEQLKEIFDQLPSDSRQTAMFSATLPHHIIRLAKEYLNQPEQIAIGQHSQPVAKIQQDVVFVKQEHKEKELIEQLVKHNENNQGSCIIFVKTKIDADRLCERLKDQGFAAAAMHGDLNQSKRQRVLQDFRHQKVSILVATDIAARGIDVSHIRLVVNYELPQAAEDYVHRIGRTARGGAEGQAISLIAPFEYKKWAEILKMTNPEEAANFAQKMGRNFGSSNSSSRSSRGPRSSGGFSRGGDFDRRSSGTPSSRWGQRSSEGSSSRPPRAPWKDDAAAPRASFDQPRRDRSEFNRSSSREEGRSSEGRSFAPRSSEGRSFGPRSSEGRSFAPRSSEGRSSEGRSFGGRSSEGRSSYAGRDNTGGGRFQNDRPGFGGGRRFGADKAPRAAAPVRAYKVFKGDVVES